VAYLRSPPFTRIVPAGLLPGEAFSASFEGSNDPEAKYLPLNRITVQNFSSQRITLQAGRIDLIIPPFSTLGVEEYGIRGFVITNVDAAAVPTNDVIAVTCQKDVSERDILLAGHLKRSIYEIVEGMF